MSNDARNINIAIGADHGGYDLKEHLREWLAKDGYIVEDCGTFDGATADYPRIASAVASRVSSGTACRGIIIDGAGIGSSMVANKYPGVRAALCYDVSSARNSREHNDANVLTLGARLIGLGLAEQIVETWLEAQCTEARHQRRVAMIGDIERTGQCPDTPTPECSMQNTSQIPSDSSGGPPTSRNAGWAVPATELREIQGLEALSDDDLDRIAARIAQLAGVLAGVAACDVCGPSCNGHCAETNPAAVRGLIGIGAGRIGNRLGGGPVARDVAQYIDHTALKPETTPQQIEQLCKEAVENHFASVCVNPSYVRQAARLLKGSPVAVCTVAGFPLGAHVPEIKAMEARRAIRDGASEVDMVINIGALKGGDDELVFRDIQAVVEACTDGRAICKVIIEAALLTDEEKVRACLASKRARADYVKTSTGFASGGATAADVALMSETVRGTGMGVKAAGGIRSLEDMKEMVQAGATRIGASAGVQIVKEAKKITVSG